MIPILLDPYASDYTLANLLSYTSTRGGLAVFTAMVICFFIGPPIMGFISEGFGLRVSFGFVTILLLCVPAMLALMRRAG